LKQSNANAARDMRNAIKELEGTGAQSYVFDLRNNPGGLRLASVKIAAN